MEHTGSIDPLSNSSIEEITCRMDWPDKRLIMQGEDVFLGEAMRQHGWAIANNEGRGVAVNTERRRGENR